MMIFVAVATFENSLPKLRKPGATEAISVMGVAPHPVSGAALRGSDALNSSNPRPG